MGVPTNILLQGDVLHVLRTLPANTIQTCITSPPYLGLRNYQLPPSIWGDPGDCDHQWGDWQESHDVREETQHGKSRTTDRAYGDASRRFDGNHQKHSAGTLCAVCGAWKGCLGLEPSPQLYVAHLVEVFREVRRVLRKDGTCWLVLGDSFFGSGKGHGAADHGKLGKHATEFLPPPLLSSSVFKQKDLLMIPSRTAIALVEDGWYLRQDVIWEKPNCLSGGAIVYARTQKSDMPMTVKDLVRLRPETVQLWNGQKWTQCIAWENNPRPDNPIEIELRNGQRVGCTPEHLWPTQRGNVRADELRVGDTLQACQLPEPCKPKAPDLLPDSIGWFIGMYLAEGSRSNECIQISGHIKEVKRFEQLCQIAESYGGTCRLHEHGNIASINLFSKVLNAIIDTYISGHGAKDKHLTVECWKRSNTFLSAVLEGYLAGDGHYEPENKRWRIGFTRNYNLEADLRTLCARLGIQLRLKPTISTNTSNSKKHPSFKGEIRYTKSDHHNNKDAGEIVHIGRSRARQFWDITVADEPHLFALASGILTHNCMPESVRDRPTSSHEHVFLLAKSKQYYYDASAIAESAESPSRTVSARRASSVVFSSSTLPNGTIPQAHDHRKVVGRDGREGIPGRIGTGNPANGHYGTSPAGRNKRSVWHYNTQPYAKAHFAVFPEKLVEPMILAGTSAYGACETCGAPWKRLRERTGHVNKRGAAHAPHSAPTKTDSTGWAPLTRATDTWAPTCKCSVNTGAASSIVLDPFAGAGTVAVVAKRLGRAWLGIELSQPYIEMAKERIEAASAPAVPPALEKGA